MRFYRRTLLFCRIRYLEITLCSWCWGHQPLLTMIIFNLYCIKVVLYLSLHNGIISLLFSQNFWLIVVDSVTGNPACRELMQLYSIRAGQAVVVSLCRTVTWLMTAKDAADFSSLPLSPPPLHRLHWQENRNSKCSCLSQINIILINNVHRTW